MEAITGNGNEFKKAMYREKTLEGAGGQRPLSAIFISDSHLLHPQNGAASIHLRTIFGAQTNAVYAVGDTIDLEAVEASLERLGYSEEKFPENFADVLKLIEFPDLETHLRVIDTMMARADRGDTVRLITGNHDIALDMLDGEDFNGIGIRNSERFTDGAGRRFLGEHGHMLDPGFLQDYQGMYRIGDAILHGSLWVDHKLGQAIPSLKYEFHLTNSLKKIGKLYIKGFMDRAMERAKEENMDGIICGHIHKQAFTDKVKYTFRPGTLNSGALYINCGDGLTHGTSLIHTGGDKDADWFLQSPKHISEETMAIMAEDNPYQEYRENSMEMLQALWTAHLQSKPQEQAVPEEPQIVRGKAKHPFPETVAASVPARDFG